MVTKLQAALGYSKRQKKPRWTPARPAPSKRRRAVIIVRPQVVVVDDVKELKDEVLCKEQQQQQRPEEAKYAAMAKGLAAREAVIDALLAHCCQNEKTPDLKRHIKDWVREETGVCCMCMSESDCDCLYEQHGHA